MESETNQFTSALENYVCGNYRSASKILDSLIEKEPSNFAYLTTGASCYIELRNNEKALDLLAKAEKLQPNSFKVNFLTGLALFYSKKYVEAQVAFTSGIQLAGNNEDKNKITIWSNKTNLELREIGVIDYNAQTSSKEVKVITNWMQTATEVVLELMANRPLTNHGVKFEKKCVKIVKTEDDSVKCTFNLPNAIIPEKSSFKVSGLKMVITLIKEVPNFNWVNFEVGKGPEVTTSKPVVGYYPSSSKVKKDWNQLDLELDKEMKEEEKDANEGMMKMFRQIYERSDEKTRRAMIKSFQTSGGTVLSTDWNDVKDKDYEGKDRPEAPKGQEWKSYEP